MAANYADRYIARVEAENAARDLLLAQCYHRALRSPVEGTATAAIQEHAVACGLVAYVFGVHPDRVARAVARLPIEGEDGHGR